MNETGHIRKCMKLYRQFVNISETYHMLRRIIAATLLKILCKNPYSVKCYDKINMEFLHLVYGKISTGA